MEGRKRSMSEGGVAVVVIVVDENRNKAARLGERQAEARWVAKWWCFKAR